MSSIITKDTYQISATVEQVKEFILTPERILDYYPSPIEGGVFVEGRSIWIRLKSGVTAMELVSDKLNPHMMTVLLHISSLQEPPADIKEVKAKALMTFYEDWLLIPNDKGTQINKQWRDLTKHKNKWLPIKAMIQNTVKEYGEKIEHAWNAAAENSLESAI